MWFPLFVVFSLNGMIFSMKNLFLMPKVHKFARENKNKKRIDPKVDIF